MSSQIMLIWFDRRELDVIDPRLEAEYNNRQKVPHHPAVMALWKSRSEQMRSQHSSAEIDVPYGEGERHRIDIFWPGVDRSAPLALFVHGGYWAALDKSWFSHLAAGFLANGIALAVPSYDLCPAVSVAAVVEDVRRATAFLMKRYDADIFATGHSAGGHMSAMLLATDCNAYGVNRRITGCCTISGLFDLVPLIATSINAPLKLDIDEASRLSPLNFPAPAGRFQAFVGELEGDEYRRQSSSMAAAWNGSCGLVADADHFTVLAPLEDARSGMMQAIVADIRASR